MNALINWYNRYNLGDWPFGIIFFLIVCCFAIWLNTRDRRKSDDTLYPPFQPTPRASKDRAGEQAYRDKK